MNEQDKEAFDIWRNSTSTRLDIHDAWQAACEYKDREVLEWKEAARSEAAEVDRLQTENKIKDKKVTEYKELARLQADTITRLERENKKLREALGLIEKMRGGANQCNIVAREALKEVGEK
jgi:cell shape-determining protein MreC